MKIYHYTSIQTLALILKNKKIRFNRLDRVDDMEESIYGSGPTQIKLGMYTFVSCWTKSSKENLALWNMYTRYKGVRIGIDEMPFVTHRVNDNFVSLLSSPMNFGEDYMLSSFFNEAKLYDMEYVDDPQIEIKKLIRQIENDSITVDFSRIGSFKRKEWEMQQESRYKITAMPVDVPKPNEGHLSKALESVFMSIGSCFVKNKPISTTHIDLDIAPTKLAGIEIMLGPLTSEADKIIVEALLKPFPNAVICDSVFKGKLRGKS